ncbi:hypothetical protein [Amycolatopsis magusensis]|uniref:hypothetical protein n=1 Tax=Amycolatopsis magusensis TaxID=882444 RepID=UPI0024A7BC1D|nr:hypothetical protein [Amycolatopsis magusensis]MDI5980106.1 hypothetical protein [Amycolatopsis magusensis]
MSTQTDFLAALTEHLRTHPGLPELASITFGVDRMLQVRPDLLAEAVMWAHTLAGPTVQLHCHSDGGVGVLITGSLAGHEATVFTTADDLAPLLPPDTGQPYYQRAVRLTLAELESHLDTAATTPEASP